MKTYAKLQGIMEEEGSIIEGNKQKLAEIIRMKGRERKGKRKMKEKNRKVRNW